MFPSTTGTTPKSFRTSAEQKADRSLAEWSAYTLDTYVSRTLPVVGTSDIAKLARIAQDTLKDRMDAYWYAFGEAGAGVTARNNRAEFDKWMVVTNILRDLNARNLETTIFGVKYPSPLFVAPVGVQGILHPDGELASAAAAAKVGVPYIMSTASSRSIEAVVQANGAGPRWFALYWPLSEDVCLSLLARAKAGGFSALVVTLDTMLLAFRPHDVDSAYFPFFHGVGCQVGFSDPVFMAKHGRAPASTDDADAFPYDPAARQAAIDAGDADTRERAEIGCRWMGELGVFRTWDDLAFLRKHWEGPLVLKGILSVGDAELAVEHGADGIVVSNHGGRQVDGAIPALLALERIVASPKVAAARASRGFAVLFDSGVRSGGDILKAVAIGADGVLCGRALLYGLVVSGEAGVEYMLRTLLADAEITLGLSGYRHLDEIRGQPEKFMTKAA